MLKVILDKYLNKLQQLINRGDAREESFYHCLKELLEDYAQLKGIDKCDITVLPKATDAGNPDFRVWDGKAQITGYIEAKKPDSYQLEPIEKSEQIQRYLDAFPNLILTNFYEFRLYQHGLLVQCVSIASAINATQLGKVPPLTQIDEFSALLNRYFSYYFPALSEPKSLAQVLAKRTRFMRDEIIAIGQAPEDIKGKRALLSFYESFKRLLINKLDLEQFADLYAQTLTYGIFVARTRSAGEFNRELIYHYIPNTLGVLKTIFKFISWEAPPQALTILIEDIAHILYKTDIQEILQHFYSEAKGSDPIVHFYETFLSEYDPQLREKRGVYYTPEPVVRYIVRSIHSLLKSHFGQRDGFASEGVTVLDPAAGTLTFPAEAIKLAIAEYRKNYGSGSVHKLIKEHILPHYYAIELMMAPYTVGHLKIAYLLAEHGYELSEDERFKLYLSNTLEQDLPEQMLLPLLHDISEECVLANEIKYQEPILVIMGNPPYSGASENRNDWTEKLMKTHLDGAQNYYTVDGMPLGEKNPKWLQDDYVKFLRFAQWKVHSVGKGVVGMITNHGYLDNPTFRGMRQSLMDTFDEIYILDLHGNVKKKEKSPDGGKDENVFDIQQGTAIILMVKGTEDKEKKVYHQELYGAREAKYEWLEKKKFSARNYKRIKPKAPFYLFRPETKGSEHYLKWHSLPEIFPLNSVGIVSARDALTIKESEHELRNTIHQFAALAPEMARTAYRLGKDARDWKIEWAQRDLKESGLDDKNIVPILYRPFDTRYTYYTGNSSGFHCRPRKELMQHVLQENISIVAVRQVKTGSSWQHVSIANVISESCYISNSTSEISYVFPLYRYPNEDKEDFLDADKRQYNITSKLVSDLSRKWQAFQPEQLFYYVYAVLHSNLYRERFAQYLRLDFPRIPITEDYKLFRKISDYGKELSEIQLLQSPRLHKPIARYQGIGSNDTIEEIKYDAKKGTVRINPDKYFEGIKPELWDYQIGAYQVLHKYLKDRKGKELKDPVHYCQMVSALSLCLELQAKIDKGIGELLK